MLDIQNFDHHIALPDVRHQMVSWKENELYQSIQLM